MATIKSYTDIEQSRKLADILPLESADMYYDRYGTPNVIDNIVTHKSIKTDKYQHLIPCWSLAALLGVLDFPSLTQNKDDEWEVCVFDHDIHGYIEKTASNPVDTCVAMIEKLHE